MSEAGWFGGPSFSSRLRVVLKMTAKTTLLLRYAAVLALAALTFISSSCRAPTLVWSEPKIHHNLQSLENSKFGTNFTNDQPHNGFRRREVEPLFDRSCCGVVWADFLKRGLCHEPTSRDLVWTVSGGPEYRYFLGMLLEHWKTIAPEHTILVIALDQATAMHACSLGFFSIYWNNEPQSYSRVADAKFQVAEQLALSNRTQLFVELDVLCNSSPLPLMSSFDGDINLIGHGDLQQKINIGMYYVRPSEGVATFFGTLVELLRTSLTQSNYYIRRKVERQWFDQDVFQDCLQVPDRDIAYFVSNVSETDMLTPCRSQSLKWNMVSNLYVSSFRPPLVYDTTVCIHPLDTRPFSSFQTKLTTAKFLGFDPIHDNDADKRTLRTLSGDLVSSEDWNYGFFANQLHLRFKEEIQRPLTFLIALANATNRELVLPRYVRDKIGKSYPVHALVDTRSIEQFTKWTFSRSWKSRDGANNQGMIVELPTTSSYDEAEEGIKISCKNSAVCSMHRLYKASRYGNSARFYEIMEQIVWCPNPPGRETEFPFTMGSGGFQYPCVKGDG